MRNGNKTIILELNRIEQQVQLDVILWISSQMELLTKSVQGFKADKQKVKY